MSSRVTLKQLHMASWTFSQSVSIFPPPPESAPVVLTCQIAVFGALLLWGHRNIELERLGIHVHDPTVSPRASGGVKEKTAEAVPATATSSTP